MSLTRLLSPVPRARLTSSNSVRRTSLTLWSLEDRNSPSETLGSLGLPAMSSALDLIGFNGGLPPASQPVSGPTETAPVSGGVFGGRPAGYVGPLEEDRSSPAAGDGSMGDD